MSEEEAIERLKERVKLDRKIRDNKAESDYEQFCENECQAIEAILNLADKQQKEIEEKNIAINKMSKDISRQLKEIEKLRRKIDAKEMEHKYDQQMIDDLKGEMVHNWIHKDKIRKRIKEAKKIMWHTPKLVIEYFEELLEEN